VIRDELGIACNIVPAIDIVWVAVENPSNLVEDHLQRFDVPLAEAPASLAFPHHHL
jgi:hypothetical protein